MTDGPKVTPALTLEESRLIVRLLKYAADDAWTDAEEAEIRSFAARIEALLPSEGDEGEYLPPGGGS